MKAVHKTEVVSSPHCRSVIWIWHGWDVQVCSRLTHQNARCAPCQSSLQVCPAAIIWFTGLWVIPGRCTHLPTCWLSSAAALTGMSQQHLAVQCLPTSPFSRAYPSPNPSWSVSVRHANPVLRKQVLDTHTVVFLGSLPLIQETAASLRKN